MKSIRNTHDRYTDKLGAAAAAGAEVKSSLYSTGYIIINLPTIRLKKK